MNNQECIIIIPCYNVGGYLAECLCSVKSQSYPHWKAIIVNDGSTDDCAHIAQAFVEADSRFVLLTHKRNRGQSAARNTALNYYFDELQAKHNNPENEGWITFLDADDYIDSDYLSCLLTIPRKKADVIQSGYRRVQNDGLVIEAKHPRQFYRFVSPCMRLYRSGLLRELRFPEGMIYEDVIFSLNLWALHPSYEIIPYIGYNYRLNPTSTTATPNTIAEHVLYPAIRRTSAPFWLKLYTVIRLRFHFHK